MLPKTCFFSTDTTGLPLPTVALQLLNSKRKDVISLRDSVTITSNRFLLLIAALIYVILTGPTYFNWAPLRSCLYKTGAYSWYCDPSELSTDSPAFQPHGTEVCAYQAIAVNRMLSIATYVHFSFAILAGLTVDWIGPKLTAVLGVIFQIIGWSMLGASSQSLQLYLPSVAFIGIGIETSFLPILSVADLFPKFSSSVVSLIGGARSLSFAIPLILQLGLASLPFAADRAFLTSVFIYVGAGLGFTLLIAILLIPMKPWNKLIPIQNTVEGNQAQNQRTRASFASSVGVDDVADVVSAISTSVHRHASAHRRHSRFSESAEMQLSEEAVSHTVTPLTQESPNATSASHRSLRSSENQSRDILDHPVSPTATSHNARLTVPELSQQTSMLNEYEDALDPNMTEEERTVIKKHLTRWVDFKNQLLTFNFLALVIFCMISVSRGVYFSVASESLLPDTLGFFGIINVFSFAPAPVFGYLCDRIGILPVMHVCNSLAAAMFIVTAFPSIPSFIFLQYAAGVMYSAMVSFLLSQVYCYGVAYFSKDNIGKLLGIVIGLGGLSCLLVDPLFSLSKRNADFFPASLGFILVSFVNVLLLLILQVTKASSKSMGSVDEKLSNKEIATP